MGIHDEYLGLVPKRKAGVQHPPHAHPLGSVDGGAVLAHPPIHVERVGADHQQARYPAEGRVESVGAVVVRFHEPYSLFPSAVRTLTHRGVAGVTDSCGGRLAGGRGTWLKLCSFPWGFAAHPAF